MVWGWSDRGGGRGSGVVFLGEIWFPSCWRDEWGCVLWDLGTMLICNPGNFTVEENRKEEMRLDTSVLPTNTYILHAQINTVLQSK